jgi:drug/metabolite transporter (DMT)-like permease
MGPAAAISGLLSAGIPAFVGMLTEGAPSVLQAIGFIAAAASIWMIAAGTPGDRVSRHTLTLSILAGVSFGIYFIGLRMANGAGILWAMAATRMGSITVTSIGLVILALINRGGAKEPPFPRRAVRFAMMTVILDTAGNMMFIAATRAGRLDVASVLASLYPASTILLAAWLLHEHPTNRQRWGMALALAAVVMITI